MRARRAGTPAISGVARTSGLRTRPARHEPLFRRPELAVAPPRPRHDAKTDALLAAFAALAAAGLAGAARSSGTLVQVAESGRVAAGHAIGVLAHRPFPRASAPTPPPAPRAEPPSRHEEPTIPAAGKRIAHVAGAAISRTAGIRAVQIALLAVLAAANAALLAARTHLGRTGRVG